MTGSISIMLAQRKTLSAELLMSALSDNKRFKVVSFVHSSEAVASAIASVKIDIVLIGTQLDDAPFGTFEVVQRIRAAAPHIRIVMISELSEREMVVQAFRSGVKGVFSTSRASYELLCKCVEQVQGGHVWASSEELNWVLEAFESPSIDTMPLRVVNASGINLLSKREEDVVKLVMIGRSNREIAQHLNLSQHTVKNYLFRVFDKLGVSSRTELLLYAMAATKDVPPFPNGFASTLESTN